MKKTKILSLAAAILLFAGSVNYAYATETGTIAADTDVVASATQTSAGRRGKGSNGQQFANTNESSGTEMQIPKGHNKEQKSQKNENKSQFKQNRKGSKSIAAFFNVDIDNASNLTAEEKTLLKADLTKAQPLYAELETLRTQIKTDTQKLKTLTQGSAEYTTLLATVQEQKTKAQDLQTQIITIFNENATVWSKLGLNSPIGRDTKHLDEKTNTAASDADTQTSGDTNSTTTP